MKTVASLRQGILVVLCCLSSLAIAQTTVTNDTFKSVFESMKTGGGSIILTEDVTIELSAGETYSLSSISGNLISIDTQEFKIIASGTGTTADNAVLEIGENVEIQGTSTVLSNSSRGIIRIVGGSVKSVTTTNSASTILGNAGWVYISGGTISMEASGVASAFAVNQQNNFSLILTGGTIMATGENTCALNLMDNVTPEAISDVSISAVGTAARAIQSSGVNKLVIGDNVSLLTSSADASDIALSSIGSASSIVIPASSANVNISATTKFYVPSTGTLIDYRGLTLSANPASGSNFADPEEVTFTVSGNESAELGAFKIYYHIAANPTSSSATITNGGTILADQNPTEIRACIGEPTVHNTTIYTFTYTVQNVTGPTMISTYEELKTAYTESQTGTGTTQLKLMGNIIINDDFDMVPDAAHPVVIDPNGFQFQLNAGAGTSQQVTFGGALTIIGTGNTNGTIRVYGPGNGAAVTAENTVNITGGHYSITGNYPIIYAGQGGVVNPRTTKIYLSDATFTTTSTGTSKAVYFQTGDGNLLSVRNCTFDIGGNNSIAFDLAGPQFIHIENCTVNMNGTGAGNIVFKQAPGNFTSTLTIDGLQVAMDAGQGKILESGGSKDVNIVILDMEHNDEIPMIKPTAGSGIKKLYDFRGLTITAEPLGGNYENPQSVTLSLPESISPDPVDATDAVIRYTMDGSIPTETSPVYASGIPVSFALTLHAVTEKDGFTSKPAVFVYDVTTDIRTSSVNGCYFSGNILHLPQANQYVRIYDGRGQLLMEKLIETDAMDLSMLSKGIYFVKVENETIKIAR